MDLYQIWCNLRPGVKDLDFADAVDGYLGHLQAQGLIRAYRLARRKFGFGPSGLGEFQIEIQTDDLAQLDRAFSEAARRHGALEQLHARVYGSVTDFQSGLWRPFPDPQRARKPGRAVPA